MRTVLTVLLVGVTLIATACDDRIELTVRNETRRGVEIELEGEYHDGRDFEYEDRLGPWDEIRYRFEKDRLPVRFELEAGPWERDIRLYSDDPQKLYVYVTPRGLRGPTRKDRRSARYDDRDRRDRYDNDDRHYDRRNRDDDDDARYWRDRRDRDDDDD
jgi:hypothetical protein